MLHVLFTTAIWRRLEAVGNVGETDLEGLNTSLKRVERFWIDQVRFQL